MKKIKLIALLLAISTFCFAQKGNQSFKFTEFNNSFITPYELLVTQDLSFWKELSKPIVDKKKRKNGFEYVENENRVERKLFKDYKNKVIYSNNVVLKHTFYIIDSINQFNWTLIDSMEMILGYKCQIAKTKFRGRSYYASFTEDIPISEGPWKFNGLPGMILKIVSGEEYGEYYKFECTSIQTHNQNFTDSFDYFINRKKNEKFITWDEFVADTDDFIKRYIKNLKSSAEADDGGYSVLIKTINQKEIFNKELQLRGIFIEF